MSIINEPLKNPEAQNPGNTAHQNAPAETKPAQNPILLYILVLLVGLFLGNIILNILNKKAKPQEAPKKTIPAGQLAVTPPALAVTPAEPPKEKSKTPEPDLESEKRNFVLNGTFFSTNGKYALINNRIVKENDSVSGAKVRKITPNSVELELEGKITTLTTNR
ncbi:MAG: hypothetical protein PHR84_02310 [Candidatus Omnitrophica bacterium]|jgi:type II secretory pathway component PulC|nr:hypothetical protein [Candidatus Omnitrophota bacterium]MDD5660512.1 hypothetical protein [Candidatus Omnitrophota bacterium]